MQCIYNKYCSQKQVLLLAMYQQQNTSLQLFIYACLEISLYLYIFTYHTFFPVWLGLAFCCRHQAGSKSNLLQLFFFYTHLLGELKLEIFIRAAFFPRRNERMELLQAKKSRFHFILGNSWVIITSSSYIITPCPSLCCG